jgi:hypothetical protein|tara:strand:- start:18 stop:176 length:159 start_codon:yes stop_codon:yes gene_type:complete
MSEETEKDMQDMQSNNIEYQGRTKKQVESNYEMTIWTLIVGLFVAVITCSLL